MSSTTPKTKADTSARLNEYLKDPFLYRLYRDITAAGELKAILIDITHVCNLRCTGCWFFAEDMDSHKAPREEADFDAFIAREKARGTNYVTVVGGEPSLMLARLKKVYENFWTVVVTNGLVRIPLRGFENMSIGISVWGDHETDRELRGGGKTDVFQRALKNYKDDPRGVWYYTVMPGNAHEIESVVTQCVANGNYVLFNFYGDINKVGGALDHTQGFADVRAEIDRMIERHPEKVLMSPYVNGVTTSGRLYGETWGHDVCGSITPDHPLNRERIANGQPYDRHFRAYNPDLATTRRCCVGNERDCGTCLDVWAHNVWIMMRLEAHLASKQEFTNWLTTVYLYYLIIRAVNFDERIGLLPEIHRRLAPERASLSIPS
jgi:MoaA/NifB/PqqE/SkfB family radical SAM enzyme